MQVNERIKKISDVKLFNNHNDKTFDDKEVKNLAEFILEKSITQNSPDNDPYWDNQCKVLLKALLLYIFHEVKSEQQNYSILFQMIDDMEGVEILFEELEKKNPDHISLKYYTEYRNASPNTRSSVQATLFTRLNSLDIESLLSETEEF